MRKTIVHLILLMAMSLLSACDSDVPDLTSMFGSSEHPELLQAVINKDYAAMEMLLEQGVDPDEHTRKRPSGHAAYSDRHTALTMAAAIGDKRAVSLLLQYNADRHEPTQNGQTPMEWALVYKHFDIARLLWEHAPHTGYASHATAAMVMALYDKDYETYLYFRNRVQDKRHIQNVFIALLRNASGRNNRAQGQILESINYLIAQGEKPGPEALYMSMAWYSPTILSVLLSTGLDPDSLLDKNVFDMPYLGLKGTNKNLFDSVDGNTALMSFLSVPSGIDMARSLLEQGANINALNKSGQNALMHFVATSYVSKRYMNQFTVKQVNGHPAPSERYLEYHVPIIKFNAEQGARMDGVDKQGRGLLQQINPDDFDAVHKMQLLKELMGSQGS